MFLYFYMLIEQKKHIQVLPLASAKFFPAKSMHCKAEYPHLWEAKYTLTTTEVSKLC